MLQIMTGLQIYIFIILFKCEHFLFLFKNFNCFLIFNCNGTLDTYAQLVNKHFIFEICFL